MESPKRGEIQSLIILTRPLFKVWLVLLLIFFFVFATGQPFPVRKAFNAKVTTMASKNS